MLVAIRSHCSASLFLVVRDQLGVHRATRLDVPPVLDVLVDIGDVHIHSAVLNHERRQLLGCLLPGLMHLPPVSICFIHILVGDNNNDAWNEHECDEIANR